MIHEPQHVAHLAATLLSGRPEVPEAHHIKAAVSAARDVLDEAYSQAEEQDAAAREAPSAESAENSEGTGKESQ